MIFRRPAILATLCLFAHIGSTLAQVDISGKVVDEKQQPVAFAAIALKNTGVSVTTDADGSFFFEDIKPGQYMLQFSAFGYLSKEDSVDARSSRSINISAQSSPRHLEEVVIDATRVDKNMGMAYNNIDLESIKKENLGKDAPYALNALPNVVVNSDAGNGVGYTGLRIRGSDGTRVNVTINGVPVNDAESQNTFWVNMPDLLSSVNSIQVQRGVGASTNGAGSFGATINFQTNQLNEKPHIGLTSTAGSFDTYRNTLFGGTGLIKNKFSLDARISRITSNGYIDRANSTLHSTYLSAGWYEKKTVFKFINFTGWEKTYQAWYYTPQDSLSTNRTYNPAGEYTDENGTVRYYDNETDNYYQNNSQFHIIHQFNKRLLVNLTGHYTHGKGFYEQYKQGEDPQDYLIGPFVTSSGDTVTSTDLIRRLWLDNQFAGAILNANYSFNSRLQFTFGGGYNSYFGKHFDKLVWTPYTGNVGDDHQYNMNTANKEDLNFYIKTTYRPLSWLNLFLDLQSRSIVYSFLGFDEFLDQKKQTVTYQFFNPKFGFNADLTSHLSIYGSYAKAGKEPNRVDFVESSPQSRPKAEELQDLEAGMRFHSKKIQAGVNVFNMLYKDQLVLNGAVNDVGAYTRINVPESYRRGVEFELAYRPIKLASIAGNLSISQNKISEFTEYVDSSDVEYTVFAQHSVPHYNTDISFSPDLVTSAALTFYPVDGLEVGLINKIVGRQYLDNTSNRAKSIDPYSVFDIRLNYSVKTKIIPELSFMLTLYNVLSEVYETNGYTFSYYEGAPLYTFNYLAPAAPFNFMGGVTLKF